MIEAVNIAPAAAPAPAAQGAAVQAPAAGADIFAQIMAAVASGLAAGSVAAEACLEPAAEGADAFQAGAEGAGTEEQASDGEENGDMAMAAAAAALSFMAPRGLGLEISAAAAPESGSGRTGGAGEGTRGLQIKTAAWLLGGSAGQAGTVIPEAAAEAEPEPAAVSAAPAQQAAAARPGTAALPEAAAFRAENLSLPEAAAFRAENLSLPEAAAALPETAAALPEAAAPRTESPSLPAASVQLSGTDSQPAAEMTPAKEAMTVKAEPPAGPAAEDAPAVAAEHGPAVKPAAAPAQERTSGGAAGYSSGEKGGETGAFRAHADAAGTGEKAGGDGPERAPEAVKEQIQVKKTVQTGGDAAAAFHAQKGPLFGETPGKETSVAGAQGTLPAETVKRLAEAACGLEAAGRGSVNFEINDGELGRLRVEMSLDGGDVKIRLETENGETGRFISEKTSDLVDALAQRGVSGEVSVFSGAAGERGAQERGQARHNHRFEPLEPAAAAQEEAPAEEDGRLNVYA